MEDEVRRGQEDDEPFSDPEERRHFFSVLDSFRQYRRVAHLNTTHFRRQNFYALPTSQWTLLSEPPFSILDTLSKVDDAIDANADLAEAILSAGISSFGESLGSSNTTAPTTLNGDWEGAATKVDMDKTRSTIHQLYRDWSAEGDIERSAVFEPIFADLCKADGGLTETERNAFKILVPGAGLGRLLLELCRIGYTVEGNEISYHQLLTSSFMLNNTTTRNEWTVYPWAVSFSNHHSREDQLRKIMVPDVHPGSILSAGSMNMTMGDFCSVYRQPGQKDAFDAIVTLFFIDTAPNLINYIEAVRNCLKQGGVWINIGPLLWHFESKQSKDPSANENSAGQKSLGRDGEDDLGIAAPGSFELVEDEVVKLIEMCDFEMMLHEVNNINTAYMQNPRSMLQNLYKPVHWVAKKR